ncbi:MAG: hypothetical protein LBH24_00420 [Clostridiales bacterium]|jgi:hypothetical protein|nr:hypothetical protein [Clostridiales bacterium]
MTGQIGQLQNDSDRAIDYFTAAMDELIGAKFILAERHIPDVLKVIAYFSRLYDLFKTALSGYNHRAEFQRATVAVRGKRGLKLPQNRLKTVAFGFCVLLEIDSEKISLREFTETYFYHSDPSWQFKNFADGLLVPLRDAVEYLYNNGCDSFLEEDAVDESVRGAALQVLHELRAKAAAGGGDVTPEKKQEILLLLDALTAALTPNRMELVPALLIGLKNTAASSLYLKDALAPLLSRLYKLLSAAGLL